MKLQTLKNTNAKLEEHRIGQGDYWNLIHTINILFSETLFI